MARYNEILVGRFNRALAKFLSMKGEAPAPQLSSDIQAGFVLPIGVEFRYLEGWQRYAINVNFGASVGNNNGLRLRNPATSGVLAVLERAVACNNSAGSDLYLLDYLNPPQTVDYATPQNANAPGLDGRQGNVTGGHPSLVVSSGQPAALAAVVMQLAAVTQANADFIVDPEFEMPIPPGAAIQLRNSNVNVVSALNLQWRERPIEASEVGF